MLLVLAHRKEEDLKLPLMMPKTIEISCRAQAASSKIERKAKGWLLTDLYNRALPKILALSWWSLVNRRCLFFISQLGLDRRSGSER